VIVSGMCNDTTPSADVSSYCIQLLGRHYILEAYQELPKVLAPLDIFGDPVAALAGLLQPSACFHLLTTHICPSLLVLPMKLQQVLGRHYILEAYQELPKVLASLDIFGDPERLLQAPCYFDKPFVLPLLLQTVLHTASRQLQTVSMLMYSPTPSAYALLGLIRC
jgi:hypothetical protein